MRSCVRACMAAVQVLVFSKSYCPYCTKAKSALARTGAKDVVVHELDARADGDAIQSALASVTGIRTVPQVFVAGKCIGGGDDTAAKAANGSLATMLRDAGALA
ncbi:glutaredoxin [archaeon]|nr:MAG: glutaredoxin [archaeon]